MRVSDVPAGMTQVCEWLGGACDQPVDRDVAVPILDTGEVDIVPMCLQCADAYEPVFQSELLEVAKPGEISAFPPASRL